MALFDGWFVKKSNPDAERNHLNKILVEVREAVPSTVNVVSPTAPNRTISIMVDGVVYYLHAKTTND